jgi:NAD(P)-dependent dehydrogenase (short-subunit alcohol dehydrogenase family)
MRNDNATMLVLGGHGVFGTMIARAAEEAGWTVLRSSRRPQPGFLHVDLNDPRTLEKTLEEAGTVITTVPDERLTAERLVLNRGGLLINVSAMAASATGQLRRHPGPPRGTVVMNAGIAPGLTNLLAADLLARHPDADEVEMVFTMSAKGSHGPAIGAIAHDWLTSSGRHRTTVVSLPEPFGRRCCLGIAERHNGWLGPVADGRTVRTYMCMAERGLHGVLLAVNAAGLMGRLPASAVAGPPVSGATAEPVRHWVGVRRRGTLLEARTVRCQGDYRGAAVATVLMAGQLTERRGQLPSGTVVPEEVLTAGELEPGLAKAGITVAAEAGRQPPSRLAGQHR